MVQPSGRTGWRALGVGVGRRQIQRHSTAPAGSAELTPGGELCVDPREYSEPAIVVAARARASEGAFCKQSTDLRRLHCQRASFASHH